MEAESTMKKRLVRPLFLIGCGLLAIAVVVAAREVMLPFVLALVIAYVLTPAVAWFERRRLPRALAIVLVYALVLGSTGGFLWAIAPRMGREIASLRKEVPALSAKATTEWVPSLQNKLRGAGLLPPPPDPVDETAEHVEKKVPALVARPLPDGRYEIEVGSGATFTRDHDKERWILAAARDDAKPHFDLNKAFASSLVKSLDYARANALEVVKIGREIVVSVAHFFFLFGITLMLAAYLMLTREKILTFVTSLVRPSSRSSFDALIARMDRGLSGVVRGQLIICLVNGVLSAIGFAMVGLKYWPVMALVATVFSLIPIFGSIVSSVPAVALGLTQGPGTALFVLIWIIGIHQIEANFLNPKIMGDAAKIHPVLVIFSLLVGEHFFHTMGALLAVPCMSMAQSLFVHFRQLVQDTDPEFADEPAMSLRPSAIPSAPSPSTISKVEREP